MSWSDETTYTETGLRVFEHIRRVQDQRRPMSICLSLLFVALLLMTLMRPVAFLLLDEFVKSANLLDAGLVRVEELEPGDGAFVA